MPANYERLELLFQKWRVADAAARACEDEVRRIYVDYMNGQGQLPPDASLQKQVVRLREEADQALKEALRAADLSAGQVPPF